MRQTGTKQKILVEGQSLLQKHGYNGFSFQNIANKLGVKKPSLYDHFASKDDLIIAILEDYRMRFREFTATLVNLEPLERVRKIFSAFHAFSSDSRKVCPVLSLAADYQSLSSVIQTEMGLFIDDWLDWLEQQIKDGQQNGQIRKDIKARALASLVYSQGMGAQFQARLKDQPKLIFNSGDFVVETLRAQPVSR